MIHRRHELGKCNESAVFTIETLPVLHCGHKSRIYTYKKYFFNLQNFISKMGGSEKKSLVTRRDPKKVKRGRSFLPRTSKVGKPK